MTKPRPRAQINALALITVIASSLAASAEPVRVQGVTGETGVGWLFGSPLDGACWVATANHVVDDEGGEPRRFLWRGLDGWEGVGARPFGDRDLDVAFGRAAGVPPGRCLSRLGPRDATTHVRRQPQVWLVQPVTTSVRAAALTVGAFDEQKLIAEANDEAGAALLQRGVSGAALLLRQEDGAEIPLALVTEAGDTPGRVVAVRMDATRTVFEAGVNAAAEPRGVVETPVQILRADGESRDPMSDATALTREGDCWSVTPARDARAVEVVVTDPAKGFHGVTIWFAPHCGIAPSELYAAIPRGDGWRTLAVCSIGAATATCGFPRLDPGTPLRLMLVRRDGRRMGLASLSLAGAPSE